jgi:hypothetical protein
MNESQLGAQSRMSKSVGPHHLRIVKCCPPATRNEGARTTELDDKFPPGVLTAPNDGMWE